MIWEIDGQKYNSGDPRILEAIAKKCGIPDGFKEVLKSYGVKLSPNLDELIKKYGTGKKAGVPFPVSSKTTDEGYASFTYHKFEDGSIVTEMNAPHLSKPHFYSNEPNWTAAKHYLMNEPWSKEISHKEYADYEACMNIVHQVAARM